MTPAELAELERLEKAAFRAPWRYGEFRVECSCDGDPDCSNRECDGDTKPCTVVESPDEYPDGQTVAEITVPGLSMFADRNGAFIVALRNAAPSLIAAARENATLRQRLEVAEGLLTELVECEDMVAAIDITARAESMLAAQKARVPK